MQLASDGAAVGEEASEVLVLSDLPGTAPLASRWYLGSPFPTSLLRTVLASFNAHGSPISHALLGRRCASGVPSQGLMVLVFHPSSCPRRYASACGDSGGSLAIGLASCRRSRMDARETVVR
jgi:hypothetical protein